MHNSSDRGFLCSRRNGPCFSVSQNICIISYSSSIKTSRFTIISCSDSIAIHFQIKILIFHYYSNESAFLQVFPDDQEKCKKWQAKRPSRLLRTAFCMKCIPVWLWIQFSANENLRSNENELFQLVLLKNIISSILFYTGMIKIVVFSNQ